MDASFLEVESLRPSSARYHDIGKPHVDDDHLFYAAILDKLLTLAVLIRQPHSILNSVDLP